jgi:ADP-dependent NAD(P)H-hydrate dehydratase / NAD(P)H-hydrate epimerase
MFEPLYTADEMRAAETLYPGYPDTIPELMARAGAAVAERLALRYPEARRVTAVCGGGANGGDGRIAAELLAGRGREVTVVDAAAGGDLGSPDVVVDALFGTGFRGEPRPEAAALIEAMNAAGAPIVAVDVPSGVDASSGEIAGAAVRADLTVTFHGRKLGLVVAPGRFHAGKAVVADIGLEPAETEHRLVTREVLRLVPRRGAGDNKYTAGSVLVVGGSPGLTGAVCLAAEAAFRADAGYVTVAVPPASLPVLEARLLEAVKRPLDEVEDAAARAGALALGPGLGRGPEAKALVRRLLEELALPAVVDADALFELEPFERAAPTVLTPHAGELAGLLGEESAWVTAHRLEAVQRAATRFGCVVLLKGADTLVAAPGKGVLVCAFGPPSLATAGTGDVLTGVVAAFLAKGLEPRLAAAAAAVAHGLAAAAVPKQAGLIASDVIRELPRVLDAPL